jgi:hypothetical protein
VHGLSAAAQGFGCHKLAHLRVELGAGCVRTYVRDLVWM